MSKIRLTESEIRSIVREQITKVSKDSAKPANKIDQDWE